MSANAMKKPVANVVNGIDVDALTAAVEDITAEPAKGIVEFRVKSAWKGQTRSEAVVESYRIGGEKVDRRFSMMIDEPFELLGANTAPNPQEYLMAALNACVMVGYVAGATIRGIKLESVEIETHGELDLRGFLGIDPSVKPGYDRLRYTVRIKGDGTAEQFREIHETVIRTSPNYFNVSKPVAIDADLVVVK
jgi:uncharacterized OsmC-like protein